MLLASLCVGLVTWNDLGQDVRVKQESPNEAFRRVSFKLCSYRRLCRN